MKLVFSQRRNRFSRRFLSFVLLCLSAIAVSCTAVSPNQAILPEAVPANPQTLQVAVIPGRSSDEQEKQLAFLADYLQQVLDQPVNVQMTADYDTAVELLVNEKVEMAYLGALAYLKARDLNADLEPIVLPIEHASRRPWYTSVVVVDAAAQIQTLNDLKGKRFAFVSPASTSGFLMPMDGFQKQGIDPTRDFSGIRYSGSHDKAIADLIEGKVDAIAVDKAAFSRSQAEGSLNLSRYQAIWESEPIPTTPIVVNTTKVSPETILHLRRALIDAPPGLVDGNGADSNGYTVGKDSDFETIRQIYARFKAVSVPEK